MRLEIVLFLIAAVWIAHIYTDGKYLKLLLTYKKYYQMAGVAVGFLFLCWILKRNPENTKDMILTTHEYIKHLPVDKNVKLWMDPVLDFTSKSTEKHTNMGKRSVSDSKKKYVASQQEWKCKKCQDILPATFEVDHIVRLQYGGSNEIDNLQALCPNCHRNKTMLEAMI